MASVLQPGWRHRPVRAFVYRIPTGYLQKIGRKAHLLYTLSHMICKIANTISRPISVQSFTQPARLRADGPTSPRSTQGGWLTHDQLLQWVWGPEKTGHPWLVQLTGIEPVIGETTRPSRLPNLELPDGQARFGIIGCPTLPFPAASPSPTGSCGTRYCLTI